ncbi:cyclic GMP-AMP synthase [Drosophila ficusphila]|uniref:cyclic GMP-AMP synthase n=1 Tax=Drosophila ficusphila TaxID=30025 RepID=UPI001C8ABC89|nr:cyclic GMP-AMP synthase [Drosophila ficusphila]
MHRYMQTARAPVRAPREFSCPCSGPCPSRILVPVLLIFPAFPSCRAAFLNRYNRVVFVKFTGSSGDQLKVAKPNEFDLVFKLQIPYYESIVVTRDSNNPGNVFLNMTRVLELLRDDPREDHRSLRKLLQTQLVDAKNFLVVGKLCSWLQSLFRKALNRMEDRLEVDGMVSHLKYKTCGPAHTIYVDGELTYSVDFVPAILLRAEQNVLGAKSLRYFELASLSHWEAIPKPLKTHTPTSSISFRSSFYAAEKAMLRGKHENCRDAIKLMKKFRDVKTNLSNLKSYYIKTLFLWKISNVPETYWQQPLTDILPDMFDDLTECLRQGILPFFWDPELNMLDVLTSDQVKEMYLCVRRISDALRRPRQLPYSRNVVFRVFSHKDERNIHRSSA